MKGISAVIAVILMLVITIALAGSAYMFISGIFTSKTAVILSVEDAVCASNGVTVYVRNDGTTTSGTVTVTVDDTWGSNTIASIAAGQIGNVKIGTASPGAGYHRVAASTTGASARGQVYCAS